MSHAIVVVPSVLPVIFPSIGTTAATGVAAAGSSGAGSAGSILIGGGALGAAGFAAVAVLTPTANGILLDSISDSICMSERTNEKPCKENQDAVAKHAGDQIAAGLKTIKDSFSGEKFSARSSGMLLKEMEILENSAKKLTEKIRLGTLTRAEIASFKESLTKFSEKSAREKARLSEMSVLYKYYSDKFGKEISGLSSKYGKASLNDFTAKYSEIGKIKEDVIEEKLDLLTDLYQKLRGFGKEKEGNDEEFRLNELRSEAEFFFHKIRREAPEEDSAGLERLMKKARATGFPETVSSIRDEIKLKYQKIHESVVLSESFKERLDALLKLIPKELPLFRRISKTAKSKCISRDLYRELAQETQEHFVKEFESKRRAMIEEKIKAGIGKLDYIVADESMEASLSETLSKGGIALLDTKYPEYKLLVKLSPDDSLIIRFIKVVQSEDEKRNISETQIRHDRELMKEWCDSVDIFLDGLRQSGLLVAERLRVEDQVDYLTIEQLDLQKINTSKIRQTRKKKAPSAEKHMSKDPGK